MNLLAYFKDYMVSATLSRAGAGQYDGAGKWVGGTRTTSTIRILEPQPADGETERLIPEGEQADNFVITAVPSTLAIRTRNESVDPDEITVGVIAFECVSVGRWGKYGGFDKVLMKKKDV